MERAQGFAQQGSQVVWTSGQSSVTLVQESAPFATITVYLTGTTILAEIYSDNQTPPTPLANPFTADANGFWFFYAENGRYDIQITGPNWTWTIGDVALLDPISMDGLWQTQTPWLSSINAAGFYLNNAGAIGVGGPAGGSGMIAVTSSVTPVLYGLAAEALGQATILLQNDVGSSLLMGIQGSGVPTSPGVALFNTSAPAMTYSLSNTEVMRITPAGLGVKNIAPNYPIDVAGDVNVTGTYRISGVPIQQGQNQTPWLSSINAANFALNYVGMIGVGGPALPGGMITVTSDVMSALSCVSNSSTGGAVAQFQNDVADILIVGLSGSQAANSTGTANFNTSAPALTYSFSNVEVMRVTSTGIGWGKTPAYAVDVTGDVNVTGVYRINGVPIDTGGSVDQTPWLSNIDGGNFYLTNVGRVSIGGTSIVNGLLNITSASMPMVYMSMSNNAGAAQLWFTNDILSTFLLGLGGSTNAPAPNLAFFNTSAAGYAFAAMNAEVLRINSTGMGWKNTSPAYPLDVVGDVNVTGVYRVNGVPIDTGGGGEAQTPWLSNIDAAGYSIANLGTINGVAIASMLQTPWVSAINGAGQQLYNLGSLLIGTSVGTTGVLTIALTTLQFAIAITQSLDTGSAGFNLQNNLGVVVQAGLMGSNTTISPNTMNFNTSAAGYTWSMVNNEIVRINSTGLGVLRSPSYPLDVTGNINCSGQYLVNGVPIGDGAWNIQPHDVTASRQNNVTYTNNVGSTMLVSVWVSASQPSNIQMQVNGIAVAGFVTPAGTEGETTMVVVPNGATYYLNAAVAGFVLIKWIESY